MVSPVSVVFFLLFPIVTHGLYASVNVNCNYVKGQPTWSHYNFTRPMENGDEFFWRGNVMANAPAVGFNVYRPVPHAIAVHIRQDLGSGGSIYNEMPSDTWATEMYGPLLLSRGENFELSARLVGNTFEIRKNGLLVHTYKVQYPASLVGLLGFYQHGLANITSVEMKCANPPRRPHDHSHEHGPRDHSHEHGPHDHYSDESC